LQPLPEVGSNALPGLAVPQLGTRPRLPRPQDLVHSCEDRSLVGSHDGIGALLDGDRPLRVLAQRQARGAEAVVSSCMPPESVSTSVAAGHQAERLEVP
jgi:hypothetical protein